MPSKYIYKQCPKCGQEFNAYSVHGEKKFCSRSCANSRGPRTEEFKEKVRGKLIGKKKSKDAVIKSKRSRKLNTLGINTNTNLTCEEIDKLISSKLPKCAICQKPVSRKDYITCSKKCHKILATNNAIHQRITGKGGHQGWYNGISCDSTWELAFLIYHLDHNVPIQRSKNVYTYNYKGVDHKYLPDFIVDGKEVEIKGIVNEQTFAKLKAAPHIILVDKHDIQPYLKYVKQTYKVKDLTTLYEIRKLNK